MSETRTLTLLLMLPLLGAALAKALPATSAPLADETKLASLAFDQYLVNLRQAPLLPTLSGDYRFTNLGDRPLTITDFKPSCGCLQPLLAGDKRTYQPGERGMFRVEIATANEAPGPHGYEIRVLYEDPQPHEAVVRFKVTLPERKLTVDPPELAFFQYNGEPASRVIHITDYRGSSLKITEATANSDLLRLDILDADTDDHGNHRVPLQLSVAGNVPPGRQVKTVTIHTSDPEFATIRIPVLIDGPDKTEAGVRTIGHAVPAEVPRREAVEDSLQNR